MFLTVVAAVMLPLWVTRDGSCSAAVVSLSTDSVAAVARVLFGGGNAAQTVQRARHCPPRHQKRKTGRRLIGSTTVAANTSVLGMAYERCSLNIKLASFVGEGMHVLVEECALCSILR